MIEIRFLIKIFLNSNLLCRTVQSQIVAEGNIFSLMETARLLPSKYQGNINVWRNICSFPSMKRQFYGKIISYSNMCAADFISKESALGYSRSLIPFENQPNSCIKLSRIIQKCLDNVSACICKKITNDDINFLTVFHSRKLVTFYIIHIPLNGIYLCILKIWCHSYKRLTVSQF